MIPPIFTLLSAAPAVAALVGTDPVRIFRKVAPQQTERPYIVWRVIYGAPSNPITGRPGMDNFRVQVDCVANTDDAVLALAKAVQDELEQHGYQIGVNVDEQDEVTSLHRHSADWSLWTRRT